MKKHIIISTFLVTLLKINAQNNVSIKTFDLESIKREKWGLYGGYKSDNGDVVVKLGSPKCDMSIDNNFSSKTYTFKGIAWDFEELHFDADLNYKSSESKHFNSSIEAVNYEPIWGRRFAVSIKGIPYYLTSDYIGKTAIFNNYDYLSMGKKPFLIKGGVYSKISTPSTDQKIIYTCAETPELQTLDNGSANVNDDKDARYSIVGGFPQIGGGIYMYLRSGKGVDESKLNYEIQKYGEDIRKPLAIKLFSFDYNNNVQFVKIESKNGQEDFAVISQTSDKYAPKGLAIKPSNYSEIIILDGTTLEIKSRETFELKGTKWLVKSAHRAPNSSIYFVGPCAEDSKEYIKHNGNFKCVDGKAMLGAISNSSDELPNLQVVKISNNKVESVNLITKSDAESKITVLSGSEYKAKPKASFTPILDNMQRIGSGWMIEQLQYFVNFSNNKLILTFEVRENGWSSVIINEGGQLDKYIVMPTDGFATSDVFFSSDGKNMYWAVYEPNAYNSAILPLQGLFQPKKIKNVLAAELLFSKINLENYSTNGIQTIGGKEFLLIANNPLVADTKDELIFQGRSLNKKAKDSELVLIKVKK
ncbi:MAG TPA: hypothetical protein PKZ75_01105 [Bacteroidia bacterium]|nr:hypothetical protein [Bacteroidia bacterium]